MEMTLKALKDFYKCIDKTGLQHIEYRGGFSIGWHEEFGFMTAYGDLNDRDQRPRFYGPEFGELLDGIRSCEVIHVNENVCLFPAAVWSPVVYTGAWKSVSGKRTRIGEIRKSLSLNAARHIEILAYIFKANGNLLLAELKFERQAALAEEDVILEEKAKYEL